LRALLLSSHVVRDLLTLSHYLTHPFFFFHDPAAPQIYTLSLHDALPIFTTSARSTAAVSVATQPSNQHAKGKHTDLVILLSLKTDRKSTRLNSSHVSISYAVFCLKKKKKKNRE